MLEPIPIGNIQIPQISYSGTLTDKPTLMRIHVSEIFEKIAVLTDNLHTEVQDAHAENRAAIPPLD